MMTFICFAYALLAGLGATLFFYLDRRQKKKAAEARSQARARKLANEASRPADGHE